MRLPVLICVRPAGFPWLAIDPDGTLITARSDNEGAAPTFTMGYGFRHPEHIASTATRQPATTTDNQHNMISNGPRRHPESSRLDSWVLPSVAHTQSTVEYEFASKGEYHDRRIR